MAAVCIALSSAVPVQASVSFPRTLKLGMSGSDVLELQKILDSDPVTAISGVAKGQETRYFGVNTKDAVIRFQNKYKADILAPNNLSSGNGVVGASTLAVLTRLASSLAAAFSPPTASPRQASIPATASPTSAQIAAIAPSFMQAQATPASPSVNAQLDALARSMGNSISGVQSSVQTSVQNSIQNGQISVPSSALSGSPTFSGLTVSGQLAVGGATSTFANGILLSGGCVSVNGTCLGTTNGGGGGSGTVNSGAIGQLAYYQAGGSAVSGTSTIFVTPTGLVGIGTTSPYTTLAVNGTTTALAFTATSTTATSTFAGGVTTQGFGINAGGTAYYGSNLLINNNGDLNATVIPQQDTASNLANVVPSAGAYVYTTDTKKIFVGDGATAVKNLWPPIMSANGNYGIASSSPTAILSVSNVGESGSSDLFAVGSSTNQYVRIDRFGNIGFGPTDPTAFTTAGNSFVVATPVYTQGLIYINNASNNVGLGDCVGTGNSTCINVDDPGSAIELRSLNFSMGDVNNSENGMVVHVQDPARLIQMGDTQGSKNGTLLTLDDVKEAAYMSSVNGNPVYFGIATATPDSALDVNGSVRFEGASTVTTSSISGAITGIGCDKADTAGLTGLASSTAFVTVPSVFPGAGVFFYTIALTSTSMRTYVCSDVTVTPTASTYTVKIIR